MSTAGIGPLPEPREHVRAGDVLEVLDTFVRGIPRLAEAAGHPGVTLPHEHPEGFAPGDYGARAYYEGMRDGALAAIGMIEVAAGLDPTIEGKRRQKGPPMTD